MFSNLTVLARITIRTDTLVFVRFCVHAGPSINAGVMCTTVVKIFVAQQATPVLLTGTLPGLDTGSMDTARVRETIVTELALPPILALAFARLSTGSMQQVAALFANSLHTVFPHPAFHTGLVPILITNKVTKIVISGSAVLVTHRAVVILAAFHTDFVLEACGGSIVLKCLAVFSRVDHPGVDVTFDQQLGIAA